MDEPCPGGSSRLQRDLGRNVHGGGWRWRQVQRTTDPRLGNHRVEPIGHPL